MKSLSKKNYLSPGDKRLLEIIVDDLCKREEEIDKATYQQLMKAFIDIDIKAHLASNKTWEFVDKMVADVAERAKTRIPFEKLAYLSEC